MEPTPERHDPRLFKVVTFKTIYLIYWIQHKNIKEIYFINCFSRLVSPHVLLRHQESVYIVSVSCFGHLRLWHLKPFTCFMEYNIRTLKVIYIINGIPPDQTVLCLSKSIYANLGVILFLNNVIKTIPICI